MNLETELSQDLWAAVRRSYESQAWSNAILDGVHHLGELIRSRTGLESDGASLIGQALGGKNPKLRVNRLQSESDINVQAGLEQLLRGVYQALRNPRSHGRIDDSQSDADAILVFLNYMAQQIGQARTSFSLDEAVNRALDPNFVPNERYAALVVEEIPARQRLQVALTVLERRGRAHHERLRFFLQAILKALQPEERAEFFDALSVELRETSDDASLRFVLQILSPDQWLELSEVARLRSENRLLASFRDGAVNLQTGKCNSGSLATWSTDFWAHFALKEAFMEAAASKLASEVEEAQEFARKWAIDHLAKLGDKPSWALQTAIASRLRARDEAVYIAVKYETIWTSDAWHNFVKKALEEYDAQSAPVDDDDVPF